MVSDLPSAVTAHAQKALDGKPLPRFDEPVNDPVGSTPLRRPGSVRRTMSIDTHWPEGVKGPSRYIGICRDILTPSGQEEEQLLAQATLYATCTGREIESISADPAPPRLQDLVNVRAGGRLRNALSDVIPEDKAAGSPLYLLLDDMAGATLVSTWAPSQWPEYAMPSVPDYSMQGVCIGFRPGSSALDAQGHARPSQNTARVIALTNADDPSGWHALPELRGVTFRRARRVDVWRQGHDLLVESHFQDSASAPDGGDRIAIHEYLLTAGIGPDGKLDFVHARPGTLPFSECRAAPANLSKLIGTPVNALRQTVLETLRLTHGCTHLNDMVRSLAEVPLLALALKE